MLLPTPTTVNNAKPMVSKIKKETTSMSALFTDVEGRDLTIKDKSSEVYTKGIGDPHWIK